MALDFTVDERATDSRRAWAQQVATGLDSLGEQVRSVLYLSYFDHLTHSEIAAKLGISLATVHTRAAFGLRALATQLEAPLAAAN